jgi:hypothetical protein
MARKPFTLTPRLAVEAALAVAPRIVGEGRIKVAGPSGAQVELRGPMGLPRSASPYLVDLTDPRNHHHLIRRTPDGARAYVEEWPASNLGTRTRPTPQQMRDLAAGKPVDMGPRVSFVNDDPRAASPRRPLTPETAGMVAAAIVDSGLRSANINSTTGGHAGSPNSRHNQGRAVDINRVNGMPVGRAGAANPDALWAATAFQDAFGRQPNIRENFGPAYQTKREAGGVPRPLPEVRKGHQNHLHASGQR